eukprot:3782682-Pleurochrysis_carterae.AAC.2
MQLKKSLVLFCMIDCSFDAKTLCCGACATGVLAALCPIFAVRDRSAQARAVKKHPSNLIAWIP